MLDTHAKPNHRLRVLSSSTGVPLPFPGTIILRCRPKIQVTGHRRQRALAANPAPEKATFRETKARAAARKGLASFVGLRAYVWIAARSSVSTISVCLKCSGYKPRHETKYKPQNGETFAPGTHGKDDKCQG